MMKVVQHLISACSKKLQAIKGKRGGKKTLSSFKQSPDQEFIDRVRSGENVGIYIDYFQWNFLVRPIASFVVGAGMALVLQVIDYAIGANLIDFWMWLGLIFLLSYTVGRSDTGNAKEVVPEGRMAMVTWFGIQFRIYRLTGEYGWVGRRLRLGRMHVVKEPMTDAQGYFFTDVVQVSIWNAYESDVSKRTNILLALTKTGGEVKANLLLVLKLRDPMLWITKIDPMMDIGERARMSFRTVISFFTGKDIISVKDLLTQMMSGHTVLTCFLKEGVETLTKYSLIRDVGGDPMYESIERQQKENIATAIAEFDKKINEKADKTLLEKVHKDNNNRPVIEQREVTESLESVLHACGITLTRASVGYIGLATEVVKAANEADAQPYQLTTQLASADAARQARLKLLPTEEEKGDPTFADRQAFAAAADPDSRVEVIHVSGGGNNGDPLGIQKALAILATTFKKGGEK